MKKQQSQGWQNISSWYDACTGKEGHYYHREVILPKLESFLKIKTIKSILDLGCGQGILARHLAPTTRYLGIDAAQDLLNSAIEQRTNSAQSFTLADLNQPLALSECFDLAIFILSLQNMSAGKMALQNAAQALEQDGRVALVLNHPCFRIPRQSDWQEEATRGCLTRRLFHYKSPLKIPIQTHPGKEGSSKLQSMSYHHSLSDIFAWLASSGLKIIHLDEWVCPKMSSGKKASMENRARLEFPLFLFIVATK